MKIPTQIELMDPTLDALRELGGSGSLREIDEVVITRLKLPDDLVQELHRDGPQTELEYRLGWARTRLKHAGLIDNSRRGVWNLTQAGSRIDPGDREAVSRHYREYRRGKRSPWVQEPNPQNGDPEDDQLTSSESEDWRERLLAVVQSIPPDAFERLCRRLLRESGFTEVKVTGKSGDGGIDVEGVFHFVELISFPVKVQCKRYRGSVGPSVVRDFRGAMDGHNARGLLITTGNFTRDASKEAVRPGARPIDLIDGNQLVEKLKNLELGVKTEMVERVVIDDDWYQSI